MKVVKFALFAAVLTVVLAPSVFASVPPGQQPPTQSVPDVSSTMTLLGGAVVGLAGVRAWLKK